MSLFLSVWIPAYLFIQGQIVAVWREARVSGSSPGWVQDRLRDSSFILSLFCLLLECIYIFRALWDDIPDLVQRSTTTTALSPAEVILMPVSQVFVAPWCWRNPEEKGQGERRRCDSTLKSSKTIQKSSQCYTFCTSPAPWYCSIPPCTRMWGTIQSDESWKGMPNDN